MARDISSDLKDNRTAFYVVWGGQLVSLLGSGASSIVLSLVAYEASGSAAVLGTILSVRLFASIFAAPFIGHYVDRFSRRHVILICDISLAITSAALAAMVANQVSYTLYFPILIFAGLLDCALTLVLSASVRILRKEADLTAAAGMTASIQALPSVVAPGIGALVYGAFPAWVAFALDGCSFIVAAITVGLVRWPVEARRPRAQDGRSRVPFKGASSGLKYIWKDQAKRNLQLCFSLFNLINGLSISMLLALLLHHFADRGAALGLYNSMVALGTLIGATWATKFSGRYRRDWVLSAALLCAATFGRMGLLLWLAVGSLVFTGFSRGAAVSVSNVPLTAVWMEKVPADIQASVFGARRLLGQGPYPLALIAGGVVADALLARGQSLLMCGLGATAVLEACIGLYVLKNRPMKLFLARRDEAVSLSQ